MNKFEQKYGIQENEAVRDFHRSRRMFCIIDGNLYIAKPQVPYSHAVWFEKEGWMTAEDDHLMKIATRGFIDTLGNVYFFVGYDFKINETTEKTFFPLLKTLVDRLQLKLSSMVYGGLIRQSSGGQWPPQKCYGIISELLTTTDLQ